MRVWGITDTGLVRRENQDAYAVREVGECTLAVVCDGMGGAAGGRIASTVAVETYQRELSAALQDGMNLSQQEQAVLYSISLANEAIHRRAAEEPAIAKMGTTLVSALCSEGRVLIANIGDSRAYHITQEGITQISRDHSVVENMVERGEITRPEAKRHPNRNLITRALGPDSDAQADTFTVDWEKNEYILLCSDGLVNTVTEQEILFEVIHAGDLEHCLERLLEIAKANGAPDNVTAVLVMNDGKEAT